MASNRLDNLNISFVRRSAPKSGPTSANAWNDTFNELSNDLTNITYQWNKRLVPVLNGLPYGNKDSSINAFHNGLDGKNLWLNQNATSTDADTTFYNSTKGRPVTVYEAFQNVYTYIGTQINQVRTDLESASSELTTTQKNRIGSNIFDSSLISSASSLDGKSENNRLNIIQLAADLYGPSYALGNDGSTDLANSLFAMVNALLELHNGAWDNDIDVNHDSVSITVTQADINTSSPGSDSFVGVPSSLEEDLDQVRTQIKNTKGTGSWTSALSALYSGGADSLQDLLTSTSGSATKTASNPWGYSYTNIDGLVTRLDAIRDYTGQTTHTDNSPTYSSNQWILNGDNLETAIGKLDSAIVSTSGVFASIASNQIAISTFIGQDDLTDSTPTYSSTVYINNSDPLETAIGDLDNALNVASGLFTGVTAQVGALEIFTGQSGDTDTIPDYTSTVFIDAGDSLTTAVSKLDAARRITIDPTTQSGVFTASYDTLHKVNPTSGGFNITIPDPSGVTGSMITIKNQSDSANQINLVSSGVYTIDGQASQSFSGGRISIDLVSDGNSDWMIT